MLDDPGLRIVRHQVIILIVPQQRPRAHFVPRAVLAQDHLFVDVPLEVLKPDRPVEVDGVVDLVHVVVDGFVHGLDAAGDEDLTLELLGLLAADETLELFDQLLRFFFGDELRRLHAVDQQFQLRQLVRTLADVVVGLPAALLRDDVEAEVLQFLEVLVDGLAVRPDAVLRQRFDDLGRGHAMVVVGAFQQDLPEVEEF